MAETLLMHVHDCPACGVSLQASDQLAEEDLNALSRAKAFMVDVRHPRSLPQHRFLFRLIRFTAQATPTGVSEHALRTWLTVRTGHVESLPLGFGKSYEAPRSWAFEKMEQPEFQKLFDDVVHLILTEVAPSLYERFADDFLAMLETNNRGSKGAGGVRSPARAA